MKGIPRGMHPLPFDWQYARWSLFPDERRTTRVPIDTFIDSDPARNLLSPVNWMRIYFVAYDSFNRELPLQFLDNT